MSGSDPNSPFTPPQPPLPPPPPQYPASSMYPNQPQNWYHPGFPGQPEAKQHNVVGIIGLSLAIIGFICACIPVFFTVGWVLLPVAFVLSIVGVALTGKTKGTSIAGIITSVAGGIVGFIVFLVVVVDSFMEVFGDDTTTGPPDRNERTLPNNSNGIANGENGSRDNPVALGTLLNGDQWDVTVQRFEPDMTDEVLAGDTLGKAPRDGYVYGIAELEVTYTGQGSYDPWFDVDVAYVTDDGDVTYSYELYVDAPENEIFEVGPMEQGETTTANYVVELPEDNSGLLQVTPGYDADKTFVATE